MLTEQLKDTITNILFQILFILIFLLGLNANAHANILDFANPGTSLSQADSSFLGETENDRSGRNLAQAGDVNGDGIDDLIIGAMDADADEANAGKIYIFLGTSVTTGNLSLADADYILSGTSGTEYAGYFLAGTGDFDGDGLDDIIISAFDYNDTVYIVLGKSLTTKNISLADADYAFTSENVDDSSSHIASAGDIDGDGLDEILIGAPYNDEAADSAGKTYLILGSTLASGITSLADADYMFTGENELSAAGIDVASAGDVDGDGLSDIIIGAHMNGDVDYAAGKTYILLGSSITSSGSGTHSLATADYILTGEASFHYSGMFVGSAGDVDGDGLSDVLIGAHGGDITYLVLGRSLTLGITSLALANYSFTSENPGDHIGYSLSKTPGDVDGDGLDDILLGARGNDDAGSNAGKAYVFLADSLTPGRTSVANADYIFIGEAGGDYSAQYISFTGDVNNDHFDDVLIAAFRNSESGFEAGKTYLILGEENCVVSANAGPDQIVGENASVSLDGSASVNTCNYGTLTHSWELTYGPETNLSDNESATPSFTSGVDGDIYVFTLTVEVAGHPVDSDTVVITVSQNQAPIAHNTTISTYANFITLIPSATDPDGDTIQGYYYRLTRKPRGSSSYITESGYTTTATTNILLDRVGTYIVSYKVYDGQEWSNLATMTVIKSKLLELPDSYRY